MKSGYSEESKYSFSVEKPLCEGCLLGYISSWLKDTATKPSHLRYLLTALKENGFRENTQKSPCNVCGIGISSSCRYCFSFELEEDCLGFSKEKAKLFLSNVIIEIVQNKTSSQYIISFNNKEELDKIGGLA